MKNNNTVILVCSVFILHCGQAKTLPGTGKVGERCVMGGGGGGGVSGVCEEVRDCVKDGGVIRRQGEVKLCTSEPTRILVCCRRPLDIAKQLCDTWSQYWRGDGGHCVQNDQLIFGGKAADPEEFPHIAILGSKEGDLPINWGCGGSLISPHYVLTAAHCVQKHIITPNIEYWVKLGEYDREINRSQVNIASIPGVVVPSSLPSLPPVPTSPQAPSEQIRRGKAIIYPDYFFKYHDIALIQLETPVVLTSLALPACLPYNTTDDLRGKELTVAGWGWTNFATPELTRILQKVTVPVVDLLECHKRLPDLQGIATPKGILPTQLCAGAPGRDSCKGDSGGPLISKIPRGGSICEHTVEGIVSFGYSCGDIGVYTRVSEYLDWILGYVAPN
ncbi:hypothetical protein Pmani_013652 [Petrolisthes manimaculis]|uniref:Peptidase S1 domain-containing protein n=1 Tax=Petrolisthes manimaculis TaxID=1843537 RepID=A0AAE1PXX0_9EUCA|nr:hypothetical protein Pmani_013652 [Petrolisthes manimaculis]